MDRHYIIQRLNDSLDELESAIATARKNEVIKQRQDILDRMNSYEEAVKKQRALAHQAFGCIEANDPHQLFQIVIVINQLSNFIKNDARSIVEELQGVKSKDDIFH